MNKKRLQRLGVVCMAAAMVLTTVSFPRVAKAEGETSTQTEEATSTKPEKGKVLVQVDQNVLKANAMCNSEMDPAISWDSASNYTKNIDGQAEYAFDGDERLGTSSDKITGGMWHSRYTNTSGGRIAGTSINYSPVNRGYEETIDDSNRPWIGSGFGRKIMLAQVTYMGRYTDNNVSNNIADYVLYYANMNNPNQEPGANDWQIAKKGTLAATSAASDIVLDTAVEATHFKLVGKTVYNNQAGTSKAGEDALVCAREIKVYELKDIDINLTAPTSAGGTNADATTSEPGTVIKSVQDISANPATMSDGWNSNTAYNSSNVGAAIVHKDANVQIGNTGLFGYIKDLKIYSHLGNSVTSNQGNYSALVSALSDENNATKVFDLSATAAVVPAYTLKTVWDTTSQNDPETGLPKNTYTETVTVEPTANASIVTAPEAVTVNIDGNTQNNKVVPVSEDSTVADNGTATVKYVFEDMLRGGSLRMITANGETDYTKTSMRFGYDFQLPTDTAFNSCEWYYGTTASDLKLSLTPGANTKKIENPTATKQGYIRSNIVFTNIAKANFDRDIVARVLVKYTKDGKTYSKMGAYVDQNSVSSIAEKIKNSRSETEKNYVNELTKTD